MHETIMTTATITKIRKTKSLTGQSPKRIKVDKSPKKIGKSTLKKIGKIRKSSLKKFRTQIINKQNCQHICNINSNEGRCGSKLKTYKQKDRPFCYLASAFMILYRTPIIHLIKHKAKSCSDHSLPILQFLRKLKCNNFNLPKNLGCTVECVTPKDLPYGIVYYYKQLREKVMKKKAIDKQFENGFPLQVLMAVLMACEIPFRSVFSFSKYNTTRPIMLVRKEYESDSTISYDRFCMNYNSFITKYEYSQLWYYVGTILQIQDPTIGEHVITVIRCSEDENNKQILCDSNEKKCIDLFKLSKRQQHQYFSDVTTTDDVFILKSKLP